jgi:hypothetical protein
MNRNLWWGYKHINGNIQVKRYFGIQDLYEAKESPFVDCHTEPFEASDREEAIKITKEQLE